VANPPGGRADEVSGGHRSLRSSTVRAPLGGRNSTPTVRSPRTEMEIQGARTRLPPSSTRGAASTRTKRMNSILQRNSYRRLRFIHKDFFNPPLRDGRAFDNLKKNATLTRAEVLAAINEIPGCPQAHLWKSVDKNGLKRFSRPAMAAGIGRCPEL